MSRSDVLEVAPPPFKIDKILKVAVGHASLFRCHLGAVVSDNLAARWAVEIRESMWGGATTEDHLRATFAQYVGTTVDERFVQMLALQVAARADELPHSMLLAYTQPARPEWVAVEVTDVKPAVWRDTKPGVEFAMEAMTGHPAGHTLMRKFPRTWLGFLARQVGFNRRMAYDDEPRLFVGLRFLGFLKPRPESTEVDFDEWYITPQLKKHNVTIIKLRTRFEYDKAECPFDFQHQCHECTKELHACPASYLRKF